MLDGLPSNFMKSCRIGASGAIASSISITHGSTSYSTSISSQAFAAIASVVAATAATGWPGNSAFSRAITLRHIQRMSWMPSMTDLSIGKSTMSRADTTALTPGSASAFEVSIDLMRACGCGLRSTLPQIMPGMLVSAAIGRAARHLVGAVGPDGALADPLVVGDDVHCAASRISSAVSITARTILS